MRQTLRARSRPPSIPMRIPHQAFCAVFCVLVSGCYSASFYPVPDYANLRLDAADNVVLRFTAPSASAFSLLGLLHVADIADPREKSFLDFVRFETARRGGDTAWIMLHAADIQIIEDYFLLFTPILPWAGIHRTDFRTIKIGIYRKRPAADP